MGTATKQIALLFARGHAAPNKVVIEKLREKDLDQFTASKQKSAEMPNFFDWLLAWEEEFAKARTLSGAAAETRGKAVGEILVRWYGPGFASVQHSDDRLEQTRRNLHTAFALGAYQREHGNYPKTLAELAPKYLANIPQDLFTGKSLVYQPSANGYLLYSFGINGRDDQGRGYDDDPPGDDLSVRMPLPALPPSRARVIAKNAMARQQWSHVTIGERRVEKSSECHPCIHRH